MQNNRTPLIIMARGQGERLWPLTQSQSKPSLPFADQFRMIDFVLSNGVNSECSPIVVLAKKNESTLENHCSKYWGNEIVYKPAETAVLLGNATSVLQFISEVPESEHIIIAASDHIYQLDFQTILQHHIDSNADATIVTTIRSSIDSQGFGVLKTQRDRVTDFVEKPNLQHPILQNPTSIISMGIYVFQRCVLEEILFLDDQNPVSSHDMGRDIIPLMLTSKHHIMAVNIPTSKYWKDVGTLNEYWNAHQDWFSFKKTMSSVRSTIQHSQVIDTNFIGQSTICESAVIDHCIIRNNVSIGANCHLRWLYIGDGCTIESNIKFSGSYSNPIFIPENTVINEKWIRLFSEQ